MTRTTAQQAELALLLEVATTPKPGNVDRRHDHDDLRFEHFLTGAVGASEGLEDLADPDGPPIGVAFEHAVAGMSEQSGGNTQFGGLLLLAPLVRAAGLDRLMPDGATTIAERTGTEDAAGFYRAFEHVDVAVADPPEDMDALDVCRGSDALPEIRDRNLSLYDVLASSADHDGIAREWTNGFERTFDAAERLMNRDGPILDRAADVFLEALAAEPDTFVAINHGEGTAADVRERAEAAQKGRLDPETLAEELLAEEINPGTTADILASGLFVALEQGAGV